MIKMQIAKDDQYPSTGGGGGKYWHKGREREFVQWRRPTCGFYLVTTLIRLYNWIL